MFSLLTWSFLNNTDTNIELSFVLSKDSVIFKNSIILKFSLVFFVIQLQA